MNPKIELAHAGLFHTNTSDKVICFARALLFCSLKQDDEPWLEHYQHASDCQYLKIVGGVRLWPKPQKISRSPESDNNSQEKWNASTSTKVLLPRVNTVGNDEPDM